MSAVTEQIQNVQVLRKILVAAGFEPRTSQSQADDVCHFTTIMAFAF